MGNIMSTNMFECILAIRTDAYFNMKLYNK